jgi:hypothetical protein
MHNVTDTTPDAKTQVWHNVSRRAICGIHTSPTRASKIVFLHLVGTVGHIVQ